MGFIHTDKSTFAQRTLVSDLVGERFASLQERHTRPHYRLDMVRYSLRLVHDKWNDGKVYAVITNRADVVLRAELLRDPTLVPDEHLRQLTKILENEACRLFYHYRQRVKHLAIEPDTLVEDAMSVDSELYDHLTGGKDLEAVIRERKYRHIREILGLPESPDWPRLVVNKQVVRTHDAELGITVVKETYQHNQLIVTEGVTGNPRIDPPATISFIEHYTGLEEVDRESKSYKNRLRLLEAFYSYEY